MTRTTTMIALGFGLFVFLGASALVARALSATGAERSDVRALIEAEARGDTGAVLAAIPACARDVACAGAARAFLPRLERPGRVEILQYRPSAQVALTRRVGTGRVAWRAGSSLPVVQCVRVRREGPLTGGSVALLSVSPPIGGEASCPS